MLDNDTYGKIDSWHENGILAKKYDVFLSELEPYFQVLIKEKFNLENPAAIYILFDDQGDIIYALDYLNYETNTCERQTQELIEKIKELAK